MLYVPSMWDSTLEELIMEMINKQEMHLNSSQNFVIAFQGECTKRDNVPTSLCIDGQGYDLTGTIYGNQIHAIAIIHTDDRKFLQCDDKRVNYVEKCTTFFALMIFYK